MSKRGARISPQTREHVLQRDGGCILQRFEPDHTCNGPLELHHRKLRRHGDHTPENLITLCMVGHRWVHDHPAISYAHGLLLRSGEFVALLEAP